MATEASRPGRRLIVFALSVVVLYGGVALGDTWKPKLGLDLQGGTRITLEASTATGEDITPEKLEEARGIIDQRVNGQGVSEAEVAVQGNNNIVVEIPAPGAKNLVDSVKQTAQLRFRLVAASPSDGRPRSRPRSPLVSRRGPSRATRRRLRRATRPPPRAPAPGAGPCPVVLSPRTRSRRQERRRQERRRQERRQQERRHDPGRRPQCPACGPQRRQGGAGRPAAAVDGQPR